MEHFYVWRLNKWKRWMIIGLFALFAATFLWFERDGTFSVFLNDEPSVLTKGNAEEPNIALTFNISWGEEKVHNILAQLKKENVKATFFVSGEWAERHPDILKKITEDQHELGMLGYRYKSYLEQDIDQVRKDLTYAKEIFNKLGYEEMDLLRPPNGHFNKEIIELAEDMDFKVIHWNVNPSDWKNPGTEQIIDSVIKQTTNGDILLFHASDSAKQTAGAMEKIIPILKNKGFTFVSLSELINQAHTESKLVE